MDFDQVLAEVEMLQSQRDWPRPGEHVHPEDEEDEKDADAEDEDGHDDICDDIDNQLLLRPRSYRFFYRTLLRGVRLWQRPPHNHCERCAAYEKCIKRISDLSAALVSRADSVDHAKNSEFVASAGGSAAAWEEVRKLQLQVPDLQKHVDWDSTARAYLKKRRSKMPITEVEWQLDYGGVNDSANKKVSVWSATVLSAPATKRKQEHFDFFFDQSPSKDANTKGTAKKDGLTGIFMLGEMLDRAKSPSNDGVALFRALYPTVDSIILSGDTGNGYRAYAMLQELSKVFQKYGYKVKLIPLAPGHAWNLTDARIAHMNTFLNVLLRKSRVFGAIGIATAFRAASDFRLRNTRKFMDRSHIFFVEVEVDRETAKEEKKLLGAPVTSPLLDGGKMGVRGFLYFEFAVKDPDGQTTHIPGYALAREHADPDRPNNPTYLWTWRKDLAQTICQPCSDEWGGPVLLDKHGCTKKGCAVASKRDAAHAEEAGAPVVPGMPLQRNHQLLQNKEDKNKDSAQNKQNKKKQKIASSTHTRPDPRQVRVVHGKGVGGKMEVWLYVPEKKTDKSATKRKGWWLYPEKDSQGKDQGLYYIGPYLDIQSTQKEKINDVTVFKDFPFTRSVQVNADQREIPTTVRCVTDRPMTALELSLTKADELQIDDSDDDSDDGSVEGDTSASDEGEDDNESDGEEDAAYKQVEQHSSKRGNGSEIPARRSKRIRQQS